jgi:hypothetical protein
MRKLGVPAFVMLLVVGLFGCRIQGKVSHSTNPVPGSVVASRAGISVGVDLLWESDAARNADLDAIVASGAKWVGIDVDWKSIQGDGPTSYRWDRGLDATVLAAHLHGLSILGDISYSPAWARKADCPAFEADSGHCFPANANDYAVFAGAAAQRYGANGDNPYLRGSIESWQLWNEPNHQEFSQPRPDPDKYAAMVKGAYAHIKAADSSATVVTGGTAPAGDTPDGTEYSPATWLRDLYQRGAGGSFDAVGHHPYMFPTNPLEPHPWNAFTQTQTLHEIMAMYGDGNKKIWGTEMGAPTGTDTVDPLPLTEAQQAQWVHDYYLGWNTTFRDFTGPLIWMSLRDLSGNLSNKWDNMGLLHLDRAPKPAYTEYQSITRDGVG